MEGIGEQMTHEGQERGHLLGVGRVPQRPGVVGREFAATSEGERSIFLEGQLGVVAERERIQ